MTKLIAQELQGHPLLPPPLHGDDVRKIRIDPFPFPWWKDTYINFRYCWINTEGKILAAWGLSVPFAGLFILLQKKMQKHYFFKLYGFHNSSEWARPAKINTTIKRIKTKHIFWSSNTSWSKSPKEKNRILIN